MLRKIYIVIDCENDSQKESVQQIMNDLSNMRLIDGKNIESMYPFFKLHQGELMQLFNMVRKGALSLCFLFREVHY